MCDEAVGLVSQTVQKWAHELRMKGEEAADRAEDKTAELKAKADKKADEV